MQSFVGSVGWLYTAWAAYGPSGTTAVAGVVAVVAFQQWRVARSKLKLDLYDRRYAIYSELLNNYQRFKNSSPTDEHSNLDDIVATNMSLIPLVNSGRFLFDPKDGVTDLMRDFVNTFSFDAGEILGDDLNMERYEGVQRMQDRAEKLLAEIEVRLEKYLSFYKA